MGFCSLEYGVPSSTEYILLLGRLQRINKALGAHKRSGERMRQSLRLSVRFGGALPPKTVDIRGSSSLPLAVQQYPEPEVRHG